jgi:hypothetical protein
MTHEPPAFWPLVFRVKGVWNCAAGVTFFMWDDAFARLAPHTPP